MTTATEYPAPHLRHRPRLARSVGHNRTTAQVTAVLHSLAAQGLAASRKEDAARARPTQRWFPTPTGDAV